MRPWQTGPCVPCECEHEGRASSRFAQMLLVQRSTCRGECMGGADSLHDNAFLCGCGSLAALSPSSRFCFYFAALVKWLYPHVCLKRKEVQVSQGKTTSVWSCFVLRSSWAVNWCCCTHLHMHSALRWVKKPTWRRTDGLVVYFSFDYKLSLTTGGRFSVRKKKVFVPLGLERMTNIFVHLNNHSDIWFVIYFRKCEFYIYSAKWPTAPKCIHILT